MRLPILRVLFALAAGHSSVAVDAAPSPGLKSGVPELARSRQLIVVTVKDWNSATARICCYERPYAGHAWKAVFPPFAAVVGRNGMAWGIGLHGTWPVNAPFKREGDGRAPAGVFSLREIFGHLPAGEAGITAFPYLCLNATTEGVDDVKSPYYNRVVDSATLEGHASWNSSEKMGRVGDVYRWGVVVEHNWRPFPGYGSCIFMHIWLGPDRGTSGCTAMAGGDMERIVRWLKQKRRPVLVQLPVKEYGELRGRWGLP